MTNTFISIPKRGDIVVKVIATKEVKYISLSSFSKADLNESVYEIVGVVYYREGNNVGVVYKNNASNTYCNRAWWYLSGFTLDGTDRTGIISARFASNSYASNIDKTISYNATTVEDFVSQLNAAFAADSDFTAQDWYANVEADGETVRVHCNNIASQQCSSNTAKSGFTLTGSLPEIKALANMRRKHGGKGGEGAISNLARAIAYYRQDNGTQSYQGGRTTEQTSIKQGYPINLPTWLGTSTKNPGDFCVNLRAVYGEGEAGWLKFMKSCLPVLPTDYGNMGQHDGKVRTAELASHTFTSGAVTTESPCCNAASYCHNISTGSVDAGEFWLPTVEEVAKILDGVEYGTTSSRTADVLNEALYKIGGTGISNGTHLWSCCRCNSYSAWFAYGSSGFFNSSYMYFTFSCVPVSLYKIA